ncbi:putative sulfate exporter family transporter [Aliiroseovarius sp. M344]|nr:putative sulfate exporter family transporter [Aliiroseovarius sp. M344]
MSAQSPGSLRSGGLIGPRLRAAKHLVSSASAISSSGFLHAKKTKGSRLQIASQQHVTGVGEYPGIGGRIKSERVGASNRNRWADHPGIRTKNEHSERNLIFTVLSVTVLSTIAMIVYPILTETFDFNDEVSGVFLGGTIHDVAQVVGAGFSVSDEAGEVATLVKLIRVAMLAPVVLIISMLVRRHAEDGGTDGKRPPILPTFVIGFLIFAALNSFGLIPTIIVEAMSSLSRWALLISIAAVGMKTSLKRILEVGGQAIALIVVETVFIALFVLAGVALLGH